MAKCHWQAPEGVWAAVVALQEGLVFLLKEERRPLSGIGGKRPFRVRSRVDLGCVLTGFHNRGVLHLWVFRTLVKQISASPIRFALHLFISLIHTCVSTCATRVWWFVLAGSVWRIHTLVTIPHYKLHRMLFSKSEKSNKLHLPYNNYPSRCMLVQHLVICLI